MGPSSICLVALLSLLILAHSAPDPTLDTHWQLWVKSIIHFPSTQEEERARRTIWEETLKFITVHNLEYSLGLHTYEVGMNHLGDMTVDEFTATMSGFKASDDPVPNVTYVPIRGMKRTIPHEIDWREKGCVTDVKSQGKCGSCYAFSALGAMEGQWQEWSEELVSLSEQNIVDCSRDYGNSGCKDGTITGSFEYIKDHGVASESSYPYKAQEGAKCYLNPNAKTFHCKGYKEIEHQNEEHLMEVVGTIGPVAVAIDATHDGFKYYTNGVYTNDKCNNSNGGQKHAVLVVGYGREDGKDYWLVKNSNGPGWGDKGYIKMRRNYSNHCGIANHGAYPIF
uniref:Cathepsin S n=1 Tax=Xenopus tropicalis TaxID=8364 RepID=A0A803JEF7_XENTR